MYIYFYIYIPIAISYTDRKQCDVKKEIIVLVRDRLRFKMQDSP